METERFETIIDQLIRDSEKNFEIVVRDFPFVLVCDLPYDIMAAHEHVKRAIALLQATNDASTYMAFPTCAIGKYKECSNNIYFKDEDSLLMFKLSFDPNL